MVLLILFLLHLSITLCQFILRHCFCVKQAAPTHYVLLSLILRPLVHTVNLVVQLTCI